MGGRVIQRTIPDGSAGRVEIDAGLAAAELAAPSHESGEAEALLVVAGFLRRPSPELRIVALDAAKILAA